MALKANSSFKENKLGLKVEGELNDFQIVEEKSDSDDDIPKDVGRSGALATSESVSTISNIPNSLIKSSSAPICGNVAVSNSDNVVIGNHTYFNGPVVIKQVIQSSGGFDNPSFVKTDEDETPVQHHRQEPKDNTTKRFHIQKWLKITFSAVCLIILGGVFAILSIILSKTNQDNSTFSARDDEATTTSNFVKVVGLWYDNFHLIVITIVLMPLTFMVVSYLLLTLEGAVGDKHIGSDIVKRERGKSEDLTDDYDPYAKPENKAPLIIAPDHLRIVSRTDWLAQPVDSKLLDKIRQPVPWVIISHTATEGCTIQSQCVLRVRVIQTFHIESRDWDDIGYNFLVAGDGSAYYGRGWDYIGAHTLGYNRYSIGISFIGTFNTEPPPQKQIDACLKLLKRGVALGKLAKDYKLFAHRQLASTLSPGDSLFDIIKEWPHFVKNFTDISELLPPY